MISIGIDSFDSVFQADQSKKSRINIGSSRFHERHILLDLKPIAMTGCIAQKGKDVS